MRYPADMAPGLTAEALGELAQSTPERIRGLTQLGLLRGPEARYSPGDVHRIRLIEAFAAAGVPPEALARASDRGTISLAYYDQLHQDPGTPSTRTYGELLADLGDTSRDLRRLFGALGVAEPDPGNRLSREDERLLVAVLDALEANRDRDLALRALHVFGDYARRGSEAAMSVYGEAVERATADIAGIPAMDVYERFLQPWARFARLVPELSAWLHSRQLSAAIDAWSVEETERLLGESGFVPLRQAEDPAIAFIDLTAFTRLAEEHGDRVAASVASEFANLASRIVERRAGRLVKQLGDGVLLRFPRALDGVESALDVLDRLEPAGLPTGHAGIAAGPLIVREGDVFGRTVNRASRIADQAPPGQLLAPVELAAELPAAIQRAQAGVVSLQGIADPTTLVRLWR